MSFILLFITSITIVITIAIEIVTQIVHIVQGSIPCNILFIII